MLFFRVINTLPEPNIQLLKHFMVLLYQISENADTNKMSSTNLATCVSPNLLQTDNMEKMEEVSVVTSENLDLKDVSHDVAKSQKTRRRKAPTSFICRLILTCFHNPCDLLCC